MFAKLSNEFKPDVVLMSGDYTSHDVATKSTNQFTVDQHYQILKEIYTHLFEGYIKRYFSNSYLVPAIGNNDYKKHYGYPMSTEDKQDFYSFAF